MNRQNEQANGVKTYLDTFYCILDEMIYNMTSAELTDSISYNFIVQMIPHHRAAIEMSQNVLNYTENPQIEHIARGIISAQTKSIENMCEIECICREMCNPNRCLCQYQSRIHQIMRKMFAGMGNARSTGRIDCNFMREMIPHHMGAVEMSAVTLQYNICPKLIPILQAIYESQTRGITEMQKLLRCLRCR